MMSEKIRPHHLERKAILYVRQSSAHQVLHNSESSAVHPNQITAQLEGGACEVFGSGSMAPSAPAIDVKSLHAKIGELTLENDF
jgi:hypothetical protein